MRRPSFASIAVELESWRGDALSMAECVDDNLDRILAALRVAEVVQSPTRAQMDRLTSEITHVQHDAHWVRNRILEKIIELASLMNRESPNVREAEPCLCKYAIVQVPGGPVLHDPRCSQAEPGAAK